MSSELKTKVVICQVKEELNKSKIKLWLEPYYNEELGVGSTQEQSLQDLCKKIAEDLNIDHETCISALRDLQNHALDRLKSNQVFKESGIARLKVRVSGKSPRSLTINILLTASAEQLTKEVSTVIDISHKRIKLISAGKVLEPSKTLQDQGIKNGAQLMAVILAENGEDLIEAEKRFKTLESTKKDVHLLAGKSSANNEHYLQVENQAGETLDLPYHERKVLVTAMALHEKGRAALKKKDFSLALILFLEADKEYSECTSEILKAVDNYALLHLDIAWCYLILRNPEQIPDAARRLSLCEQNFHRSYGPNLERLMAIKGTTGSEAALFMRLHLLQGVVLFHQNKRVEARTLFERAQTELNGLKVDDNSLCLLMELGSTSSEARLALRATRGNIELAEEFIHHKRTEKERAHKANQEKLKYERERVKLGLCADKKNYCEPKYVSQMETMGFDRRQSIQALKMANNSMSEAVKIIQDTPYLLPSCSQCVSQESVNQLTTNFGVPSEVASKVLESCPELERVVKSLSSLSGQENEALRAAASASAISILENFQKKRKEREEKEMQAFNRVSEGLIDDLAEDHLDLNLAQEEQFLVEYLSLLN